VADNGDGHLTQLREVAEPLKGFEQHEEAELMGPGPHSPLGKSHFSIRWGVKRMPSVQRRRAFEAGIGRAFNRGHAVALP
jgi:hypothetical protein